MSTDDAPPASNERDTPTCKKCHSSEQVRDVAMYGVDPGVRTGHVTTVGMCGARATATGSRRSAPRIRIPEY